MKKSDKKTPTTPPKAPTTTPPVQPTEYTVGAEQFRELIGLIDTIGIDKYRKAAIFNCINDSFRPVVPEKEK